MYSKLLLFFLLPLVAWGQELRIPTRGQCSEVVLTMECVADSEEPEPDPDPDPEPELEPGERPTFGGLQRLPEQVRTSRYHLEESRTGALAVSLGRQSPGTWEVSATVTLNGVADGQTGTRGYRACLEGSGWPWTGGRFCSDLVKGTGVFELSKRGTLPDPRSMTVKVEAYGSPSGTIETTQLEVHEVLPPPVSSFMLYPNYRGVVEGAEIRLNVSGVATVTLEDGGKILDSKTTTGGLETLDASKLGSQFAVVRTKGKDYEYPEYAVKRGVSPIDRDNRFLRDGKPYIPIGVYDSGLPYIGNEPERWRALLDERRRLSELKPDIYLNYHYGQAPAEAINGLMEALDGLHFQGANCFAGCPGFDLFASKNSARSPEFLDAVSGHKNWGGVYVADEAHEDRIPAVWPAATFFRKWPGFNLAVLLPNASVPAWRDVVDIVGVDPYPIAGGEPDFNKVPQAVKAARESVQDARPVMAALQFFQLTSAGRWPTQKELESMGLASIAEGADAVLFWSIGNGTGALFWSTTCATPAGGAEWCPERVAHFEALKGAFETLRKVDPAPGVTLLETEAAKAVRKGRNLIVYNKTAEAQTVTVEGRAVALGPYAAELLP